MQLQDRLKCSVGEVGKQEKRDMRNLLIGILAESYTYRDLMAVGIRIEIENEIFRNFKLKMIIWILLGY